METENQLTIIDPREFGLKEENVKDIEKAFKPKIIERDGLHEVYGTLIKKEISNGVCVEARDLRLKLVKVRTGISDIHKTQKSFFLASGKFVDAWKNKETLPVIQMEEKLLDLEKYYEKIEQEKKDKIRIKRISELEKYEFDTSFYNLGEMPEEGYTQLLESAKFSFETKKKADQEIERQKIKREKAYQEEQEKIRKDNERLREQASEREVAEKKRAAKEDAERKEREEKERKKQVEFDAKLKEEREKREKIERDEHEKHEKLKAEIKAKEDAERKEREKIEARQKAAELAPDKKKLESLAVRIVQIELPELKSEEAKAIIKSVVELLNKTSNYIKEKTINL